ncbi:hypothetical protein EON82_21210, partial [bacterium]
MRKRTGPQLNEDEWRVLATNGGCPPNSAYNAFDGPITSDTWIAWGNYTSEMSAPSGGYPFLFATAHDCLLWLKVAVLEPVSEEASEHLHLVEKVDDPERQLRLAEELFECPMDGFEIYLI